MLGKEETSKERGVSDLKCRRVDKEVYSSLIKILKTAKR